MPPMPTKSTKTTITEEPPVIETELMDEPAIEQETITFKKSQFFSVLSVLTFILGLGVGYLLWGSGLVFDKSPQKITQVGGTVVEAPVTAQPQFVRYDVPSKGFYSIGPENAPITIVEFSDYQCPYCRRWHDQVYQSLLNAYPGKIRFVYRNLPLTSIHPEAFPAAEAAQCAGEQNAYWPFHNKLFSSDSLGNSVYIQYARELGLDLSSFENCLSEHKYKEAVQADLDFAVQLGARSTPTFFINGLAIVGAQPLDVFKQVIDKELAGQIP
jgi:protein-disulfide isomerase